MKNKKKLIVILSVILLVLLIYLIGLIFFSSHFLPNTSINQIDVSLNSLSKANEKLNQKKPEISIIQKSRDSIDPYEQIITFNEGITYDASVNLKKQNSVLWFIELFKKKENDCNRLDGNLSSTDHDELIFSLYCLDSNNILLPQDAHFEINEGQIIEVPASDGCYIDENKAKEAVDEFLKECFLTTESLTLDLRPLYEHALIYDDDPSLSERKDELESILSKTVTLDLSDSSLQIDRITLGDLIVVDPDIRVNEDKLNDYLLDLSIRYDDASSYIDKSKLTDQLKQAILVKDSRSIEVSYKQGQPIRKVEVSISKQTLYYYEDEQLVMTSPVVSGNKDLTNETPHGTFEVRRMVTDTNLVGKDYIEHVDYWIGFDESGGIYGLHDASWRNEFGSDIYTYDPSRGCVNMPLEKIAMLYKRLELGDEITIYE